MINWDLFLCIKKELQELSGKPGFLSVCLGEEVSIHINKLKDNAIFYISFDLEMDVSGNQFLSTDPFCIQCVSNDSLAREDLDELLLYLPYALLPLYSADQNKCFSISHFAQTLDGKIASSSGDSKWIGNQENLVHAHKMRALCDAIMIGANTLAVDNPSLNVRHVEGEDPVKVIIGGDKLALEKYKAIDDNTIMFCQNHIGATHNYEKVCINYGVGYDVQEILLALKDRGISSVYIEGGSFTTSQFLKNSALDQVQVHISPKILGSGTSSFLFEGISTMAEAKRFTEERFVAMGNEVMFIGNLKRNDIN